jgi:hypothetical protein
LREFNSSTSRIVQSKDGKSKQAKNRECFCNIFLSYVLRHSKILPRDISFGRTSCEPQSTMTEKIDLIRGSCTPFVGVAYRQEAMRHIACDIIHAYMGVEHVLLYICLCHADSIHIYMSEKTVSVTPSVLLYPHKGGGGSRRMQSQRDRQRDRTHKN